MKKELLTFDEELIFVSIDDGCWDWISNDNGISIISFSKSFLGERIVVAVNEDDSVILWIPSIDWLVEF